jgi:hypothetical protein
VLVQTPTISGRNRADFVDLILCVISGDCELDELQQVQGRSVKEPLDIGPRQRPRSTSETQLGVVHKLQLMVLCMGCHSCLVVNDSGCRGLLNDS